MSATLLDRRGRGSLVVLAMLAMAVGAAGPVAGASVIRSHGTVGAWEVADDPGAPGARCRYEGAAGSFFLQRVRVHGPGMYGTESGLRSVGYRMLLQRRTPEGWKTTQRGVLKSSAASLSVPVALPDSAILRDPAKSPNSGRYRAALKLIWWDEEASVQGVVVAAMGSHRRSYDSSVGPSCKAQVTIPG